MATPLLTFAYDGSFAGLLSAFFEAFRRGGGPADFVLDGTPPGLFDPPEPVATDVEYAARVAKGIDARTGRATTDRLYRAFLSEAERVERTLYGYVQAVVEHGAAAAEHLLLEPVLQVEHLAKRTNREVHRMHAYVRFAEQADGSWRSIVAPDCHVLPLIGDHFRTRFPALDWTIHDVRRHLALSLSGDRLTLAPRRAEAADSAEREARFQDLWRTYFEAVTIPERVNPRLQCQHLPHRYRRHLTEFTGLIKR